MGRIQFHNRAKTYFEMINKKKAVKLQTQHKYYCFFCENHKLEKDRTFIFL